MIFRKPIGSSSNSQGMMPWALGYLRWNLHLAAWWESMPISLLLEHKVCGLDNFTDFFLKGCILWRFAKTKTTNNNNQFFVWHVFWAACVHLSLTYHSNVVHRCSKHGQITKKISETRHCWIYTRWWFQIFFMFACIWGNHQPVIFYHPSNCDSVATCPYVWQV